MSTREPMTAPGYDAEGRWHGPSTAEVQYWKARALKAEEPQKRELEMKRALDATFGKDRLVNRRG